MTQPGSNKAIETLTEASPPDARVHLPRRKSTAKPFSIPLVEKEAVREWLSGEQTIQADTETNASLFVAAETGQSAISPVLNSA